MNTDKDKQQQENTVGEVGSSLEGGFEQKERPEEETTNKDQKGKKVDADLDLPADRPADQ